MMINFDVPYFSQKNNEIQPWRTCGSTSAAMCMKYFGIGDPGWQAQYEDDVKAAFDAHGLDHGSPGGIRRLLEYG